MIRMTKQTDYGIMALTYFANYSGSLPLTARDVARGTGLSLPMVSKVLKLLSRKGLLAGIRGVRGGYSLVREAERISVADIINALEGPISMTECSQGLPSDCTLEERCPVSGHWQAINETVRRALGSLTLASMAAPPPQRTVNFGGGM